MSKSITINKADLELVQKFLDENPDILVFNLHRYGESGIGYCLDIEYEHLVNGRPSKTRVELAGVESW